ncbi:hypothetical protein ACFY2V_16985 [Streptomyces eurythermus]|uniref:hypothetical protein n=1 Tax=Streptomyces eurythermus TaxID=42237 RepID=UPI0036B08BC4
MPKASRPNIQEWAEQTHQTILGVADMLGVPHETYTHDPRSLVPALQDWIYRAPLDEFGHPDWLALHEDLLCYLADFLIQRHGAHWQVEDDSAAARGYRYVIEATGVDGRTRRLDPAGIVRKELASLPIEIVRMLAAAELGLHLTSQPDGEAQGASSRASR